jgi:hypothetical protein
MASVIARATYTRQSTLFELSRTRTGRILMRLIAVGVRANANNADEARMFAGATGYLTLEKLVVMSNGKLTWPVADSILDFANGRPWRALGRVRGAQPMSSVIGSTSRSSTPPGCRSSTS